MLQQGDQLQERVGLESLERETERVIYRRIGPICPRARDAKATALAFAEDQRIHTRDSSFLEYFEALAAKWMERMTDLRPS